MCCVSNLDTINDDVVVCPSMLVVVMSLLRIFNMQLTKNIIVCLGNSKSDHVVFGFYWTNKIKWKISYFQD